MLPSVWRFISYLSFRKIPYCLLGLLYWNWLWGNISFRSKRTNPNFFRKRLNEFLENTRKGILYGEWNDNGRLWVQLLFIRQQGKGPERNANLRPRRGFRREKASFGWALFPRKRLSYSLRPAFEDATDGKEKNHASAVCRVSRSLAHLSSTVLDPHCHLRSICCPFFSRLSHDKVWWYSLCSVVVFEAYDLFLWFLPCVCRASAIRVSANPSQGKNVDNGRSLVAAPALCIQLVSANQYVCKTTKQRASKTLRQ